MTLAQEVFLKDELWMLSFGGSFQRNGVYNEWVGEKEREDFRKGLRIYIEDVIHPAYKKQVGDKPHGANIIAIIDYSRGFSKLLSNGELNVGAVQKILNLSLKYYWCLGWLPEPPHFPIDSRIQKCLPFKKRRPWTSIKTIDEYQTIINSARDLLLKGETLAIWELHNFKRS